MRKQDNMPARNKKNFRSTKLQKMEGESSN